MQENTMNFTFLNRQARKASGKRIAVVGAGPAGLATTGYLATAGHSVTVYEALSIAGGLMTYAIPEYRIPVEHIQQSVTVLNSEFGVQFYYGTKIIGDSDTESVTDAIVKERILLSVLRQEFDAVLLATGSWKRRYLGIKNEHLQGVYSGIDYLYRIRARHYGDAVPLISMQGEDVLVIGAGFTAIDVATRALEQKANSVTIAYRKTMQEAPAGRHELMYLLEQGVKWKEFHTPSAIEGDSCVTGMRFEHAQTKESILLPCSVVLTAIGDTVSLPNASVCESILADKENAIHFMQQEHLYIAGDALHGATKIGRAVASGLRIARFLEKQFEQELPSCYYDVNAL